jgi:hypothetical protein
MFSPQIVESEEFLTMPSTSQALYFHLGMNADDDGFIQPKITMRTTGANDDDLKVLLGKRFLLPFESGVVVIKHWLIHNLIQKDRYHQTRFQEEKKLLYIKENKAYTNNNIDKDGSVNKMLPEVRLGKVRLDIISDYKNLSAQIDYESKRTFKDKTPDMSFLMGITKKYGKAALLNALGRIRESGTTPKDPVSYLSKVFINQEKEGLIKKMKV